MNKNYIFSDNVNILSDNEHNEYFAINIIDNEIFFFRYAVPGRYDIYEFGFELEKTNIRNKIKYHSDLKGSFSDRLENFKNDLKDERVKKLIKDSNYKFFINSIIKNL